MFAKVNMNVKNLNNLPVNYNELSWYERKQVREKYIEKQHNKCCHCKGSLNLLPPADIMLIPITPELFPEGFFNYPIHLHHNHETGMTIGAVHAQCNAILWEYENE